MTLLTISCILAIIGYGVQAQYPRLETYNVDQDSVSVSGLSAGAVMANQYFVAKSRSLKGAAIFAGLPYGCMKVDDCLSVPQLLGYTYDHNVAGNIDGLEHIAGKKVYVWHGLKDFFYVPEHGLNMRDFYRTLRADVGTNLTSDSGHGQPSLDYGIRCDLVFLPGINKCFWSGAYHSLQHIYGNLIEPAVDQPTPGQFIEFSQTEFPAGEAAHSFDEAGYAYIPSGCISREKECRLHVVFHGCFLHRWLLGDTVARNLGYNPVGELNDIILLYPQLAPSLSSLHPGCWDSIAYTGPNFDWNTGTQITIVQRMIDRVIGAEA